MANTKLGTVVFKKENIKELKILSEVKVWQSCPNLCDTTDHTVHGILQARILEWLVMPSSKWSSQPRDWTQASCIAGRFSDVWATREAQEWILEWVKVKVTHLCQTLWDSLDCIVHGILQAWILEWIAFPFFRGSSQPREQTQDLCIASGFFTSWATREAQYNVNTI